MWNSTAFTQGCFELMLISSDGKTIVHAQHLCSQFAAIDLSNLPPGCYVVIAKNEKGQQVVKKLVD